MGRESLGNVNLGIGNLGNEILGNANLGAENFGVRLLIDSLVLISNLAMPCVSSFHPPMSGVLNSKAILAPNPCSPLMYSCQSSVKFCLFWKAKEKRLSKVFLVPVSVVSLAQKAKFLRD